MSEDFLWYHNQNKELQKEIEICTKITESYNQDINSVMQENLELYQTIQELQKEIERMLEENNRIFEEENKNEWIKNIKTIYRGN